MTTTTSTIYLRTSDRRGMLVRVKRTVTCSTPPAPSERVDKALAALKGVDADYPQLQARRAAFVRQIRERNEGSDTSMAAQLDDAGYGSAGPM